MTPLVRGLHASLCGTLIVAGAASPAGAASFATSITSGTAIAFTSNDNTTVALAAGASLTATVTIKTTNGTGSATVGITSPADPIGTSGSALNLGWITATCTFAPNAAGFISSGAVTLVPSGSVTCGTAGAGVNNKSSTMTVTFALNATKPPADTWAATPGFSLTGTAS